MKIFLADQEAGKFVAVFFALCGLLYLLVSLSEGTFIKSMPLFTVYYGLVICVYLCLNKGTYITINQKNNTIQGTAFFIGGHITKINDILKIGTRFSFGGIMKEAYMTINNPTGGLLERGLTTVQMYKKRDFTELITTIHSLNSNIELSSDLKDLIMEK
jgi:hypothetical protein